MIEKSIFQSVQRLQSAEESLAAFEAKVATDDLNAAKRYWWAFLVALAGIYTKLEQGSKCCGKCEAWFGRVERARKTDELLKYLHHARNADEHGLDEVLVNSPQRVSFDAKDGKDLPGMPGISGIEFKLAYQGDEEIPPVQVIFGSSETGEVDVTSHFVQTSKDRQLTLVQVGDSRFGDKFQPPFHHLGNPIQDVCPLSVGTLGLAYVRGLVSDAKTTLCRS